MQGILIIAIQVYVCLKSRCLKPLILLVMIRLLSHHCLSTALHHEMCVYVCVCHFVHCCLCWFCFGACFEALVWHVRITQWFTWNYPHHLLSSRSSLGCWLSWSLLSIFLSKHPPWVHQHCLLSVTAVYGLHIAVGSSSGGDGDDDDTGCHQCRVLRIETGVSLLTPYHTTPHHSCRDQPNKP